MPRPKPSRVLQAPAPKSTEPICRAALHYYGGIDFARPGEKAPLKLVRVRSDYAPAKALTEAISRPHTDETFYLVAGTIR